MKMGEILMKKVRIDEKGKNKYFLDFFQKKCGKMSKRVENDENESDIEKNRQN